VVIGMSAQMILDRTGSRVIVMPVGAPLLDVIEMLSTQSIGTVMLTDAAGNLAGILSERDIIRTVYRQGSKALELRAEDLMQRSVITCTPDMSIEGVLALMSTNTIRHVPVVRGREILGLVSVRDVLDMQKEMLLADAERRSREKEDAQEARAELQRAYDGLENRIRESTEELQKEVRDREQVEEELLLSIQMLRERINELQETKLKLEKQREDLHRMSDELRAARDDAQAANKAKSEFLANISHELRTPLVGIIGFSEIMETETLGPIENVQYREYAGDINQAGQHLLALINNLLNLSKIESGKEDLFESEIDIGGIVAKTVRLLHTQIEENQLVVECEVHSDMPKLVADEGKVKQILINLLGNAVKFTGKGGRVAIKAWARQDSGCVIQIADTGIGIAPHDIPKALAQFGQVDGVPNRKFEGTGLGLPLAKSLVELHGGVLDLQSEVGMGTTVTIRFPVWRLHGTAPSNVARAAAGGE
jgi:signal transduction histidine kinase